MVQAQHRNSRALICCQCCVLATGEAIEETDFESVAFLQGSGFHSQKCGLAIFHPRATDKKAVTSSAAEQGKPRWGFPLLSLDNQKQLRSDSPGEEAVSEKPCSVHTDISISALHQAHCLFLGSVKPIYLLLVSIASWASRPRNPVDRNLLSEGPVLKNSLRDSCAPLDCCLSTHCPTGS